MVKNGQKLAVVGAEMDSHFNRQTQVMKIIHQTPSQFTQFSENLMTIEGQTTEKQNAQKLSFTQLRLGTFMRL